MKKEAENYPVLLLCRVMQVSRSSFYDWLKAEQSDRDQENAKMRKEVAEVYDLHSGRYGRRRIAHDINEARKRPVSIGRVERRMKELGLKGYQPKSFKKTTIPDPTFIDSPNLVADCEASGIDEIWVSDITYIATLEGWVYLCTVMDLYSRKIVGWATRNNMKAEIVLEAFDAACKNRKPDKSTIFHSDKGGQYKAKRFRRRLKRKGFKQSMTGVDHCFDNAYAESLFGTLKTELIRGKKFATRAEADAAIFEYIEVYYNRVRRHSALGYKSPEMFENIA